MAHQKRKQRTREHIIADLSINHVEYYALKCGCSIERIEADYGYDLQIYTYTTQGEFENGVIYLQVKATDTIALYERAWGYSFSLEKAHVESWVHEPMPVIIVLYDADQEIAYWAYLQAFFEHEGLDLRSSQETVTLHFLKKHVVNEQAIMTWKGYKEDILTQLDEKVKHHAERSDVI